MNKSLDIIEYISIIFGGAIGLAQIESILGIIILAFQVCLIVYKGIKKIIELKNKGKNIEVIEEAIKTTEEVKDLVDKVKENQENGKR